MVPANPTSDLRSEDPMTIVDQTMVGPITLPEEEFQAINRIKSYSIDLPVPGRVDLNVFIVNKLGRMAYNNTCPLLLVRLQFTLCHDINLFARSLRGYPSAFKGRSWRCIHFHEICRQLSDIICLVAYRSEDLSPFEV